MGLLLSKDDLTTRLLRIIVRRIVVMVALGLTLSAVHWSRATTTDPNCEQTLGEWQEAASLPNGHYEAVSTVVNDRLWLFTGFEGNWPLIASYRIDVYNPKIDIWETEENPLNPMPFAGSHIQSVRTEEDIWFVGGFEGNHPGPPIADVWRYHLTTDQWTQGPSLPEPRASGGAVFLDGKIHFFGGLSRNRNSDYGEHFILDLDNPVEWTSGSPVPRPRNHFPAVVVDNLIYLVGGQYRHDTDPVDLAYLDIYDPTTDTWSEGAPLPIPRSHFEPATVVVNDRIIIVGGRSNGLGHESVANVTEYNPQTDTWTELRPLPYPLLGVSAAYIDGKLIVTAGGSNFDRHNKKTLVSVVESDCVELLDE